MQPGQSGTQDLNVGASPNSSRVHTAQEGAEFQLQLKKGLITLRIPYGVEIEGFDQSKATEIKRGLLVAALAIKDPDIPELSIGELGLIQFIRVNKAAGTICAGVAPTVGADCHKKDFLRDSFLTALQNFARKTLPEISNVEVQLVLDDDKPWRVGHISSPFREELIRKYGDKGLSFESTGSDFMRITNTTQQPIEPTIGGQKIA
ncbi:MAG: hypothetical protein DCC75_10810 [Proteobacteria bacterium]|nr:MAG: hypothetical protein DCC75_10810 [Pseudomonadota bacterium]